MFFWGWGGLANSAVCWVFKCCIYSEINEWPPLSLWEKRQIETTCLLHCRLSGLLTCTSQNHPHSDTLLQRALKVGFLLTDVKTVKTRIMTVSSDRKASIWICCQRMMHGSRYLEHEFKSQRVACKCTTSCWVKVTQNRASYKMLQWAGREKKKDQIVCLCTHCIPGYLYRLKKLCRLHVSTWWELLNYWWMFLITSHKCWNTTLLQCLEEEGVIMSHMFREALACT